LNLIARGYTYDETAQMLKITLSTVQTYIRSIYGKLAVNSRAAAVLEAHKMGLLQDDLFVTRK
jgi:DNA-binding CsgD family transcriptional regulator